VCFTQAASYFPAQKCRVAPYPLRFTDPLSPHAIHGVYKQYQLAENRFTLLILGGSQGSQFINKLIIQFITEYPALHEVIQIIHQTGSDNISSFETLYTTYHIPHVVFTYTPAIEAFYTIANVALCRAGAGTLFELLHFKIPCITIPLQTKTTDHQKDNVATLAAEHPTLIHLLEESHANAHTLAHHIRNALTQKFPIQSHNSVHLDNISKAL
jgi:UDP-N-acetylglucosamine--N-acetylmuramyl-(pentapeptide) pyrophosphoryl-undecaprenol N-acetylglucosamine transferase